MAAGIRTRHVATRPPCPIRGLGCPIRPCKGLREARTSCRREAPSSVEAGALCVLRLSDRPSGHLDSRRHEVRRATPPR